MPKFICKDCMVGEAVPCTWVCYEPESKPVSCPMGTCGEDAEWELVQDEASPTNYNPAPRICDHAIQKPIGYTCRKDGVECTGQCGAPTDQACGSV